MPVHHGPSTQMHSNARIFFQMVFLDVFGDATFCRTKETLPTSYQNEQKGGSQAASRHGCLFHLMYLSPETNVPCP